MYGVAPEGMEAREGGEVVIVRELNNVGRSPHSSFARLAVLVSLDGCDVQLEPDCTYVIIICI